jgi:hypothetical protein
VEDQIARFYTTSGKEGDELVAGNTPLDYRRQDSYFKYLVLSALEQ